jgi:hypothetical protein
VFRQSFIPGFRTGQRKNIAGENTPSKNILGNETESEKDNTEFIYKKVLILKERGVYIEIKMRRQGWCGDDGQERGNQHSGLIYLTYCQASY